ncbi:alkaline shock response membrane anchor protein AmaP [Gordonia sp. Z-3]|jgi:hypothetical protein|uniref:Alkaline shock response membrane anchor protein AmaP n=2 Tax=Gordonia TaxID=2053 RepID=A0A9X3D4L6_9ACTN|nr:MULTISPECIES: alkaline shock response membrane anchor protein AmaP [Gordonia]MAU84076.1 hypothetical protein [Gordonia sp. (in: high G+C Gram-positive bacteria)]MCF3937786.1 alkaline shock response membrane anchor protein AmaP [Gordonia tangerina]MCX2964776.1 alkaline shock response membrane anchor protein AmaP [Gordonia aquimaris]MED5800754.1 alkaline shock response membrane anchor protein AmaP [Gordonia sp. Z-3]
MNRRPAVWHRLTVAVIGALLVAVGAGALLWRAEVGPVRDWIDRIDAGWAARTAETAWWPAILGAVAIVAALWGLRLLTATVRPGKVDDLVLDGSNRSGVLTVPPKLVATAVGAQLAANPLLDGAKATATDDRGRKIIRLTVTAQPTRSYDELAGVVGDAVDEIRDALEGAQVHVQAFIHLEPHSK